MIKVEIIGGPRDGQRIALPDGTWELKMAVPMNLNEFVQEAPLHPSLDVRQVRMPIKLTPDGWRAYWKEPSC